MDALLAQALQLAGSKAALARSLGYTPEAVPYWIKVGLSDKARVKLARFCANPPPDLKARKARVVRSKPASESAPEPAPEPHDPTSRTYPALTRAYDHFNVTLFGGRLPFCLVTLQRRGGANGYFSGRRFGTRDGLEITDEIALNPQSFRERTTAEILSTLVHEMVHLEQHHFGTPPRRCYHDREWAQMMRHVGLIPTDTGEPGGKETGQRVSHYPEPHGPFEQACAALLDQGFDLPYVDRTSDDAARRRSRESKTKFSCPECRQNFWAKPDAAFVCYYCGVRAVAASSPDRPQITRLTESAGDLTVT